jgi:WD40 repeat protein
MGICLIGIVLSLLRSDGCGRQRRTISGLSFSHDGELLAVARLDAREAQTPGKLYWANVCRTVSLLDVEHATTRQVLEQDLRSGDQGPAFHLLHPYTSLIFTRESDTLYVPEFGGGRIRIFDPQAGTKRADLSTSRPGLILALRQDERVLAAGGYDGTVIWDLTKAKPVRVLNIADMGFVGSPLLCFSAANDLLVTVGSNGIEQWDTNTLTSVKHIDSLSETVPWMTISPDGQRLIIARYAAWDIYDFEAAEQPRSKEIRGRISFACFVPNRNEIAISSEDTVSIVNADTQELRRTLQTDDWVSVIAISTNGDRIAAGTSAGSVTLWDTTTGTQLWRTAAPGRVRPPWTMSLAFGVIWLVLWWRLRRPSTKAPLAIESGHGDRDGQRERQEGSSHN